MPHTAPASAETAGAWRLAALEAELRGRRPDLRVELAGTCDSTSTRLLERARDGDTRPVLLAAVRQSAGRGRMGRSWVSSSALCFSLGLALAPKSWSGLSLAVGVALAEALDPADARGEPRLRLKWPNDLWLGSEGRKLGGVLIETIAAPGVVPPARQAVIGIGLNLDAPEQLDAPAAGWREAEPGADAPSMLARVAPALLLALDVFEREGFAAFAGRYARRDALAGRRIAAGTLPPCSGAADGVDDDGALRIVTPEGALRRIDSGEVSVRMSAASSSSGSSPC
ncbi:MAG TPA: biotin--[acetyl-CoA-carboxylase] ligase [Methylibium sp.]|nr:biotin--[acetyl-CoA-carboxylase] ligase [Methylibium sp.]